MSKMMCGIKQENPSPCFCHILTGHINLSCLKGKIPAEENEKKNLLRIKTNLQLLPDTPRGTLTNPVTIG